MRIVVVFILSFFAAVQVSPANARSVQSVLSAQTKYEAVYQNVDFPPPDKLIDDADDLSEFYGDVRKRDCSSALLRLAEKFRRKNPNLPNPHGEGIVAWNEIVAPRKYPELMFCRTIQYFNKYNREVKENAISGVYRFTQFAQPLNPDILPGSPLGKRASAVGDLVILTLYNYAPAHVALVKLSEEGEAVRLTPPYAYYLLMRAKRLGYTASDLAPLLKKATAALTEDERQNLAPRIESGDWPNDARRVVD